MDVCCGSCQEIYSRNSFKCPACGSTDQGGAPDIPDFNEKPMTAPDPKPAPMSDQEALAVLRDVVRYERKVGNDEWADEIDQARAHIAARLGSGEVVATVGECAELQWHKGGVCQLPPGTKLYTHPQPAAVSEAEVEAAARTMFDRHCSGKTYVSAEHTEHSWNCLRDVYIADARAALTAARAAKGEG